MAEFADPPVVCAGAVDAADGLVAGLPVVGAFAGCDGCAVVVAGGFEEPDWEGVSCGDDAALDAGADAGAQSAEEGLEAAPALVALDTAGQLSA